MKSLNTDFNKESFLVDLGACMSNITFRIEEIWERPIRCYARRGGKRSMIFCEKSALHKMSCRGEPWHAGRGSDGRWYFW